MRPAIQVVLGFGARKTLTPTLSHGEREEEWTRLRRPLHIPGLGARKTPHRFRPKTPESFGKLRTGSASPLGEGEEPRLPTVLVPGEFGARKTLTPTLSHGEKEEEGVPWRFGPSEERRWGRHHERKTLTPTLSHGEREQEWTPLRGFMAGGGGRRRFRWRWCGWICGWR